MSIKQYIRRNIYKWHRTSSIIIAIPVMCWAMSGFMHPVMTNIRPSVATQSLSVAPIDTAGVRVSVKEALQKNGIATFSNFRLVQIAGHVFYQVKLSDQQVLRYISAADGKELVNGDVIYSRFLARYFLEQQAPKSRMMAGHHMDHGQMAMASMHMMGASSEMDCCAEATDAVMTATSGSKISNVELVTGFDEEYKYINRLLPVYKVSFERGDNIRIYVDPSGDRFAFAMDKNRAAFDRFFSLFHTWSWTDALGNTKYVFMMLITALGFFTTLMGLYIFFTTNAKKKGNGTVATRRLHRVTALTASLFVMMFTFSGGYHAFSKMTEAPLVNTATTNSFSAARAELDLKHLQAVLPDEKIINVSMVNINAKPYFQVFLKAEDKNEAAKDLMKSMQALPAKVKYVEADAYTILEGGEEEYAVSLAHNFSGYDDQKIKAKELVTRFNDEYPFVNKRLPVWKITYNTRGNERLYVETGSGALASRVRDQDLYEGYSFALLHKHHFMDWGGKGVRDASTMIAAGLLFLAALIGTILWVKVYRRKNKNAQVT